METYLGIVDCRVNPALDNEFLSLNLWGKPVFSYAADALLDCGFVDEIVLVSDSAKIRAMAQELYGNRLSVDDTFPARNRRTVEVSGSAAFLKTATLEKAAAVCGGGTLVSVKRTWMCSPPSEPGIAVYLNADTALQPIDVFAFPGEEAGSPAYFALNDTEALVLHTKNDFELALVLRKKEMNAELLKQTILERIREKEDTLRRSGGGICLVGHSQLDNWEIKMLGSLPVRNCGIRGISSFEYQRYLLDTGFLARSEDVYLVMHGTNDIVYDYSFAEIIRSIQNTVDYLQANQSGVRILCLPCLHVNGRMDRDNRRIDALNTALRRDLTNVEWVDTAEFDDPFGALKREYTIDGLHLSEAGYTALRRAVERVL